ncbi:hypothetical protein [Ruegeria sp. R14_0]|uniref:TerC family protein n=1 Tax=Ruegeria sp. R14_0 TaxID=2821100 RepID=UPI001ADB9F0E|nr:hypothetical protein [Ruegeria sp. R14_0]MBO9448210.1 hypothetical protein [Ruegeria sp. R14_0]
MLDQLPHFLWLGLVATTLDVDNALYMTSSIQGRSEKDQNRLILWGLVAEYIARFLLVLVAFYIATGKEVLFTIQGFDVTPQTVALLGAGAFLFYSSAKDLFAFFDGDDGGDNAERAVAKAAFGTVLLQMSVVNTVLSIDTVIAVADMTKVLFGAAVILAVSSVIRFLFVRQIAGFLSDHPEIKIIIYTFLMLIGLQLLLQAVHDDLPETAFNLIMVIAICAAFLGRRNMVRTKASR